MIAEPESLPGGDLGQFVEVVGGRVDGRDVSEVLRAEGEHGDILDPEGPEPFRRGAREGGAIGAHERPGDVEVVSSERGREPVEVPGIDLAGAELDRIEPQGGDRPHDGLDVVLVREEGVELDGQSGGRSHGFDLAAAAGMSDP